MEKNWYVYKHVRLDKGIPFYIGIGKKSNFGRAYEFNKEKRNHLWWKIFSKTEITVEILYENLTKQEASLYEQSLVKEYGNDYCNNNDINSIIWTDKIFNHIGETQNKNEIFNKTISIEIK